MPVLRPADHRAKRARGRVVQEQDEATEEFEITRLAGRSFDDEFGSTIDNDVLLLQAAILGIAIYTVLAISNCRDGCVGSRVLLTIGGAPPILPPPHSHAPSAPQPRCERAARRLQA